MHPLFCQNPDSSKNLFFPPRAVFLNAGSTSLEGGMKEKSPLQGKDKIDTKLDPLEKFKQNSENFSENALKEIEEALNQKEKTLTEQYKNFPEGVIKIRAFYREQRAKLQEIRQKLVALQKEYDNKLQHSKKDVTELVKPFLETMMQSAANLEQDINNSIEKQNKKIADVVLHASQIASQDSGLTVGGVCEQYSNAVKKIAIQELQKAGENITGELVGNHEQPLADAATKTLRGKQVGKLSPELLSAAGVKPGMVFFVASKEKYTANGKKVDETTQGVIPKINDTDRHWFTALDNGLFVDNLKKGSQTLREVQGTVGDRIVMNVHDPYQPIRGNMG